MSPSKRTLPWFAISCAVMTACRDAPAPVPAASRAASPQVTPQPAPTVAKSSTRVVPPDARAQCDTVAAVWRRIGNAKLTTGDTTVTPIHRTPQTQWGKDEVLPPVAACVVVAYVDSLTSGDAKLKWEERGWTALWMLSADGPDGGMMTYQAGTVRCEVHETMDGGDDSDSTYVPSPFYEQTSICWRHRPITVADTLQIS